MADGKSVSMGIFAILIPIILIAVFTGPILELVGNADNVYECQDTDFSIVCGDGSTCSNQTYVCENATIPILNVSTSLCTNASGVGVINGTPSSGCDVTGFYQDATDLGLNTTETTLLGMIPLFLVIGFAVFGAVRLFKPKK